jgi:uncharacterized protein (DUF488 family)
MKLFTIGFTKSKASQFFVRLERAGIRRVIDTRLNRKSQLSGFAKEDDLKFFLKSVSSIDYTVEALLAPSQDMLDAYRKKHIGWSEYARRYLELISNREVEKKMIADNLDHVCLLCSEATPEHCHRRLAAEYLLDVFPGLSVQHL